MIIKPYIPKEIINLILEYDGRIKDRNGKYINIISKKDIRYKIIQQVMSKKMELIVKIALKQSYFFIHYNFIINYYAGIFFDINKYEISCYNKRNIWEKIYHEDIII